MTRLEPQPTVLPAQTRDLPLWKRAPLKIWLLILGAVGGLIAVRIYAGAYFDLTQAIPAIKRSFDTAFPVDWIRHLILRDESEKGEALVAVQVVTYYFARKGLPKPARKWDRIEGRLGIVNERLDHQSPWLLLLAPFWALIYLIPGEAVGAGVLWATGANAAEPKPWQVTLVGLLASFFMGRRIARGFAYHLQKLVITQRLQHGHTTPAWWMHWPIQRRFEWMVRRGATVSLKPVRHPVLRKQAWWLALLAVTFMGYQGWYVMKYQQTFPFGHPFSGVFHFRISDLWQGVL